MPSPADYRERREIAGTYENMVLYNMCFDRPKHDDLYYARGKLLAIARIYAASPTRKAGPATSDQKSDLFCLIAKELKNSEFDGLLDAIPFDYRFSSEMLDQVVDLHTTMNEAVRVAICTWSNGLNTKANRESFCSKYLHFHRPNAFPILDQYAEKALVEETLSQKPHKGMKRYEKFCNRFLSYLKNCEHNWTPRSVDTYLVKLGKSAG